MDDRNSLKHINFDEMTYKNVKLLDTNFPTIDQKNPSKLTYEEALIEIYKKLKPGDPASLESAQNLINNLLFDDRRYDLAKVGRYKYNKKLALHERLIDQISAKDVVSDETGELFVKAGEMIDRATALNIENSGINVVDIIVKQENG